MQADGGTILSVSPTDITMIPSGDSQQSATISGIAQVRGLVSVVLGVGSSGAELGFVYISPNHTMCKYSQNAIALESG